MQIKPEFARHFELIEAPLRSDRECSRVDIIILKYKLPDVESRCMDNLIRHTDWPHKVTWYDARNQTANFSKLWNHLASESTCDYICVMDSDAYVSPNWLGKMMESFTEGFYCKESAVSTEYVYPDPVGVVVPITKNGGGHPIQGKEYTDKTPFLVYEEQVSGFFFLFRKEILNDVGYFDERFYLFGQDSEWMDRVHASRWNIVVRPDVYVAHDVSASIKKARDENEFDYGIDGQVTQMVYDTIRNEKEQGVYKPPQY